ncbi:MAG: hypothetical protein HZB55_18445 [Deltaproteobacteria bacterium]|nr:hypothetical protein [Deltaproteobacteria bacterium]
MPPSPRLKPTRPRTLPEKLGALWGGVYLFIILTLLVTLVGKACFFSQGG